jgi:hypothetical protein
LASTGNSPEVIIRPIDAAIALAVGLSDSSRILLDISVSIGA